MTTVSTPRKIATTATAGATLAKGTLTPVDATAGALTMTLPTTAAAGVEVSVEKVDASTNAVTITGTLRGAASSTITLGSQYEARTFLSEGSGSWRPVSDHRTASSLSASFVAPRGPYAVSMGDSTAYYGSAGSVQYYTDQGGDNWFQQLCARTHQRITYGGVYATGGYTVEQVRDIHLPSVLALNPRPAFAFLICGHNNSKSTTAGLNSTKASYLTIVNSLRSAGIQPILMLNMAHTDGIKWNLWLTDLARRMRLPVVDSYSPTADPAASTTLAAYSIDTLHPNAIGYRRIAEQAINDGITSVFPPRPFRTVKSSADPTDLLGGKGLFGTDTNADGGDDRWNFSVGTRQPSLVVPATTDNLAGKWQRILRDSSNAGADMLMNLSGTNRINSGFSVGDTIEISHRVRATGFEAGGKWFMVRAQLVGAAIPYFYLANHWKCDVPDGTLSQRFVVQASTTAINVEVQIQDPGTASLTLDVGEMTVRNLTTQQSLLDAA